MAGVDSLLLIAFIVVAVTLGKPVSYLNCYAVRDVPATVQAKYTYAFTTSVTENLNVSGSKLSFANWIGTTKSGCFQTKALWGLSIALWYVAFPTSIGPKAAC